MTTPIDAARQRRAVSPKEAREQSAEYLGFSAGVEILIGDETFEIPNPSLLDDDQQERLNALNYRIEQECDREDDIEIPATTLDSGVEVPAKTIKGDLKGPPYTIDGAPLQPAYNTQLAKVLFGEEGYARFKAGGGRSNQISLVWSQMNKEYEARKKADPKSVGGVDTGSPVSNGNSVGLVAVPPRPEDS